MSIDLTLGEQIEARLKDYISDPANDALNLRRLASEFEALPLCVDWEKCWAIRSNGSIVVFAHDGENPGLREESDPRLINIALFQGSITYPEIKQLVPSRPDDARDCPYCITEGIDPRSLEQQNIICYCGGLGWVPAGS